MLGANDAKGFQFRVNAYEFLCFRANDSVLFHYFRVIVVIRYRDPVFLRRYTLLYGGQRERGSRDAGRRTGCSFSRLRFPFALWGVRCGTKIAGDIGPMTGIGPGVVMATVPPGTASGGGNAVPGVIIMTTVGAKQIQRAMTSAVSMCGSVPLQY